MSISANNTKPEDDDFADIEFRPRATKSQPSADKKPEVKVEKPTPATAEKKEGTDNPVPPAPPAEEDEKKDAEPAKDKPEAADEPGTEEKAPAQKKGKKGGALSVVFDTLLVVILLVILGGGAYYIKQQMDLYRVPTPMEVALLENARLQKQHDELTDAYYRADEQIAMRQSLDHLNGELDRLQNECNKLQASIDTQKNSVLAMQHEIRTADRECRAIALSLLPGMAIGNATTTRGKSLNDAYIYRLEGKLIVLRSHEGQIRVPLRELIKKDMPKMARYAFEEEEMVDMSDFDASGEAPSATEDNTAKKEAPATRPTADYEQRGGSPTVDTSAGSTITAPVSDQSAPSWDAPSGELPF
ncbi:MAG: hypothetical protein Q4F38_04165 [Akkermansia sp.]|nr:hypothetical protein [Akkermansia sp.]